ncbi:MAG: hypothetical protein M1828_007034 [Chrysothrix sp. TS-e1954]|nr:MAG: hypothetical protein M1828_007034 [Chrysothrix sp. TS-e1954]
MVRQAGRALTGHSSSADNYKDDVETARNRPRRDVKTRFRDAVTSVIEDGRRKKMKTTLQQGMDSLEGFRKSDEELKGIENKKIRAFYEEQNERLDDWLEVDTVVRYVSDDILESFDPHDLDGDGVPDPRGALYDCGEQIEPLLPEDEQEKRRKGRRNAKIAIIINVVANVCLLAAKVVAAFFSTSLSLIASLVDSALDLLCTLIIWTTNKLVQMKIKGLRKRFPILQESVKKLMPGGPRDAATLPPTAIFAMLSTIIVKGIIWIGCARIKTTQVQALAQDCKTDVYFNSLSLAFPFIGHQFSIWWLDPVGAGLLSLYIIYDWASTCLENVARLTGVGVSDRVLKKMIFICWRFAPLVNSYKSITAYHAGDGVWVEVDLIMDERTPLEHTHDVSETLQYCLEGLTEVDRAFVTVDYASKGPSGHTADDG